jgi:hypothetical protein
MTIKQILSLPTEDLEKLSDKELAEFLGPLIPLARKEDKDSAAARDADQLLKRAQAALASHKGT